MYNIRAFGYIQQLAYYDYLYQLSNSERKHKKFIFFIETMAPYKCRLIEVDPQAVAHAHQKNVDLLVKLKHCIDNNSWSDGSDEVMYYEHREA
jgi:hypothetical protein